MKIARLFSYDQRANIDVWQSLEQIGTPPSEALRLFAHIIGAQRLWLDRLSSRPASMAVWPDMTLLECRRALPQLADAWHHYLATVRENDDGLSIEYVNSKGETWSGTVDDILMHVILHSAYHRGQIATRQREAGHTPAYTDYIHVVRQGWIEDVDP